jgi:hypothetical protein
MAIQAHTEAELLQHPVDSGLLVVAALDLILLVHHQQPLVVDMVALVVVEQDSWLLVLALLFQIPHMQLKTPEAVEVVLEEPVTTVLLVVKVVLVLLLFIMTPDK